MGNGAQPTFRIPLILLALADFGLLAARLWPLENIANMPGGSTTAMDPAITLAAYIGLSFWISNTSSTQARKSLFTAALLGLIGGLLLAAQVSLATRPAPEAGSGSQPFALQLGLIAAAAIVCGIAAQRAARAGLSLGFSVVCAGWCAMVSCLIATATILGEASFSMAPPQSSDPWKQYEGLAIGSPSAQALVHSLDTVAGFLLIGPIIGSIAGVIFAQFSATKKG